MKKLKLRRWVKVTLLGMVIISLFALNDLQYNKSVEKCVNNGNEYNYCAEGLK